MDTILSIQSHVVYGYVGNKAAVYPLQSMGFDVCPINTVQFSNHTGYGHWQGEIFSAAHILKLVDGLFELGLAHRCRAILTGYMGSADICAAVLTTVERFKKVNPQLIYLCDPVIGNNSCYVKPEVLDFFKKRLQADVITPNQYEAETLSNINIHSLSNLKQVANYFHKRNIKSIIITGVKFDGDDDLKIFASDGKKNLLIEIPECYFSNSINGKGDLFSSTFLGVYLKTNDLATVLQYATSYLKSALDATRVANESELQVLSVQYNNLDPLLLPKVTQF